MLPSENNNRMTKVGFKLVHPLLTRWHEDIQIIFCLGRNDKTRISMEQNPMYRKENIHIMGYTNEVDKLMEVSDLLITKPGGMTCSEGLTSFARISSLIM